MLAGDPAQGEAYLHEVVHLVLRDHLGGGATLGEGVAVWLGGSKGRSPLDMYRQLAEYQRANPQVTLQALVRGDAGWDVGENEAHYASGALFVEAVYRRHGVAGLRALAGTPNDATGLLAAMRAHLGLQAADGEVLERWWREAARSAAAVP